MSVLDALHAYVSFLCRCGESPGKEKALFLLQSKMAYIASHLVKGITHQQRVTRLYRNSLKHLLSWCIDRQLWRREALILRDRFDENKYEKDQKKIHKILEEAEAEFERLKHPFPYISPESPEGSKWERNIPPPPHLLHMLPWEEEWHKEMTEWAEGKD